jgi:O-antigen/teichoic acid export membrane protein
MSDIRRLLSSSSIIFVGSILSGGFSYLFNLLSARLLGPEQYSQVTAILALFTVASVGSSAILIVAMRYLGELYYVERYRALRQTYWHLMKQSLGLAAVFFIIGVILVVPLVKFFAIQAPLPVIIAFLSFFFSFAVSVSRGLLQGSQRFVSISVSTTTEMAVRVLTLVILVKLGFGLVSALWAVVLGSCISLFVTSRPVSKIMDLAENDSCQEDYVLPQKELLSYAWQTFITSFFLNIFLSLDILLVKRYFTGEIAGKYAALSSVAKLIFFLTGPVVSVMFPMISEKRTKGEKHYRALGLSIIVTSVVALLVLGVFSLFPYLVIKILYGQTYTTYSNLLPQVGLFIVFYVLINLFVNYFIAIKDFTFLWLFGVAIAAEVFFARIHHATLEQLIQVITFSLGGLLTLMMVRYLLLKRTQLQQLFAGSYVA